MATVPAKVDPSIDQYAVEHALKEIATPEVTSVSSPQIDPHPDGYVVREGRDAEIALDGHKRRSSG